MNSTLRRRKCEANRVAAGLCIRCGIGAPDGGTTYCSGCRRARRKKMKSRRRLFDRLRLCQRCGSQRETRALAYCAACRSKDR